MEQNININSMNEWIFRELFWVEKKSQFWKITIYHVSIYIIFLKWQKYKNVEQISGGVGSRKGGR